MSGQISHAVAEFMGAMFGFGCLLGAWAVSLVLAYWRGRTDGRLDRGRARVLSAVEHASAETVPIPAQRAGER